MNPQHQAHNSDRPPPAATSPMPTLLTSPPQPWRRLAGVGLLALVGTVGVVMATRRQAMEAYVSGDVIAVTSPIQGRVVSNQAGSGSLFQAGSVLLEVQASRQDAARQETVQLELNQLEAELSALRTEQNQLIAANLARSSSELERAKRELLDLQGQQQRYAQQAARYRELVRLGAMDADTLAGSEANANSFNQRVASQQRLTNDLRAELADARSQQARGSDQLPRSARRLEILELEIGRLGSRRQELTARRQRLRAQLSSGRQRAAFRFQPSFAGMVVNNHVALGEEVSVGATLLTMVNCQKLRVEALFDASKVRRIRLGERVQVRWPGREGAVEGTVVSLRGEQQGLGGIDNSGAARFRATGADRMRAQISLPPEASARECRIGERVQVDL